jgi:hypothetical protein
MNCPNCGGFMEYAGIEDGAGDYGDALAETWYCEVCDLHVDGATLGGSDGDDWPVDAEDEPATHFVDVSDTLNDAE